MLKLQLCGRAVTVNVGDPASWAEDSMGRCSVLKGQIHLSEHLDKDGMASILWHEVIHFVADSLDLELEEKQVAGLEVGLLQALKDNHELADILLGRRPVVNHVEA